MGCPKSGKHVPKSVAGVGAEEATAGRSQQEGFCGGMRVAVADRAVAGVDGSDAGDSLDYSNSGGIVHGQVRWMTRCWDRWALRRALATNRGRRPR